MEHEVAVLKDERHVAGDTDASIARLPTMRVSVDHALLGPQEFEIDLNLGLSETELKAVASSHSRESESRIEKQKEKIPSQKFSELYYYGIFGFAMINFVWIGLVLTINYVYGYNVFVR
eukprot:754273-Hanusia_phi.AAC.6